MVEGIAAGVPESGRDGTLRKRSKSLTMTEVFKSLDDFKQKLEEFKEALDNDATTVEEASRMLSDVREPAKEVWAWGGQMSDQLL